VRAQVRDGMFLAELFKYGRAAASSVFSCLQVFLLYRLTRADFDL
jgi:hypothetical protein